MHTTISDAERREVARRLRKTIGLTEFAEASEAFDECARSIREALGVES